MSFLTGTIKLIVNVLLVVVGAYLISTVVGWNFAAGLAMLFVYLKGN